MLNTTPEEYFKTFCADPLAVEYFNKEVDANLGNQDSTDKLETVQEDLRIMEEMVKEIVKELEYSKSLDEFRKHFWLIVEETDSAHCDLESKLKGVQGE